MRVYFAPGLVFTFCTIASLVLAAWVLFVALSQPSLGITLKPEGDHLVLTGVGMATNLPETLVGQRLLRVEGEGQAPVPVNAVTMIEEPDMIGSGDGLVAFFAQQERLFRALSTGRVLLTFSGAAGETRVPAIVQERRPIADLPVKFWTQLGVGLVGLVIGIWLVCLRTRDLAAWMVLVTGVGLALSSSAAGLYSSRELALSYTVFKTASHFNGIGALTFGIGMMTLFLIYPRQIVPRNLVPLPAVCISGLTFFIQVVDWPRNIVLVQDAIAGIMLALLVAIVAQVIVTRRDPAARAMLGWLGFSVALGAGGFVLTVSVPSLLGREVLLPQSTAFLFFLLIYAGIALGVARYRLFDLPTWSFAMLSYGVGVVLLLLLDAALIYGLSVERVPAFAISLAVIGTIYLPLRGRVAAWLYRRNMMPIEELYRRILEIPHSLEPQQKQAALIKFWEDIFMPLSITPLSAGAQDVETGLRDNGAALVIAPVYGLPALRLDWAKRGTRLFSSKDLTRAKSLNNFIDTGLRQNQDYLDAIEAERARSNRDMHDNIGVLLISALRDGREERKNDLIRQTLRDLREIIANPDQHTQQLPRLVADLRAEVSAHLAIAGIAVEWHYQALPDIEVDPPLIQTLRALFREGTNNTVRHSGARKLVFHISCDATDLSITLRDNGRGFDHETVSQGNGIGNLSNRVANLGGAFDITSDQTGTQVSARIPLATAHAEAAQ